MQPTLTTYNRNNARKDVGHGHSYATGADYLCSEGCAAMEYASITTTTAQQIYCNGKGKSKYYAINLF